MMRNRFHGKWMLTLAGAVIVIAMLGGGSSQAVVRTRAASIPDLTITFTAGSSPNSTLLTDTAKTKLIANRLNLTLAQSVTLTGYSDSKVSQPTALQLNNARTSGIADFIKKFGITATVFQVNGGLSTPKMAPDASNRVVITFQPTPNLLWAQNFNQPAGSVLDGSAFWGLHGDGASELGLPRYGTGEIEYNDPLFATSDGAGDLRIRSVREAGLWRSARVWTQGKVSFQYGRLEIRAKFPQGSFNWPAIWMLGADYAPPNKSFGSVQWPASGELDIAEGLGGNSVVQGTLHGPDANGGDWLGGAGITAVAPLADVSGAFHTWSIDWLPNKVSFAMDGVHYADNTFDGHSVTQRLPNGQTRVIDTHSNWPFNKPYFLILNNAIWPGSNQVNGTDSSFLVDWIRYSPLNGYGQVN